VGRSGSSGSDGGGGGLSQPWFVAASAELNCDGIHHNPTITGVGISGRHGTWPICPHSGRVTWAGELFSSATDRGLFSAFCMMCVSAHAVPHCACCASLCQLCLIVPAVPHCASCASLCELCLIVPAVPHCASCASLCQLCLIVPAVPHCASCAFSVDSFEAVPYRRLRWQLRKSQHKLSVSGSVAFGVFE
jgi:hypothetical protein